MKVLIIRLDFSRAVMYCLYLRIDRGNYFFNFAAELLVPGIKFFYFLPIRLFSSPLK
jgi:hypothetical protein